MRFFTTNYLFSNFGGSYASSSNSALAPYVFDEETLFPWYSSGENTDGNAIYLERILDVAVSVDRIFVKNTNISNLTIEIDSGAGYVALAGFTLQKSNDGSCYFYKLSAPISLMKIKFIGSNTIIANQEKQIQECLGFSEIGNLKYVADIQPKKELIQAISKLNSGRFDVINKGSQWSFKIKLKSHYKAIDNSVIDAVLQRTQEMWLWLNDDEEDVMIMQQEPFRFQDIYKVAFQKAYSPRFTKNMFFSGLDVDFDLVEVA